jgi:hypothetical protein
VIIKITKASRASVERNYLGTTIPVEIVREEGLQKGDYIVWKKENGKYVVSFEKREDEG